MSITHSIDEDGRSTANRLARNVMAQVGGFMWGACAGYAFFTLWGASWLPSWKLIVLIAFPILLWTMTFLHELGHAITVWLCGWRVVVFMAGPLGFHVAKRQVAFVPARHRTEYSGMVATCPISADVWTRERSTLISAGGPLANLLIAFALLAYPVSAPTPFLADGVDVSAITFAIGLLSLGTALHALWPGGQGDTPNDGESILHYFRMEHPEAPKWRSIAYLQHLTQLGVRLRDLPRWMVEEARARAQAHADVKRGFDSLEIGMLLDDPPPDCVTVRRSIDAFRDAHEDDAWLASCDAYFAAVWEADAVGARRRLWQGDVCEELRPLALAAEGAVLAAEGDADASRVLAEMRAAIATKSAFRDLTFRDIGLQIEALMAQSLSPRRAASA